jgi:hypothetical protein
MRVRLALHGAPGPRSFVHVRLRLRVCAVPGPAEIAVEETLRTGGRLAGEHSRTLPYRQRRRCLTRAFRWRLCDEFLGVGTYRVAATARDRDGRSSRTVSRRVVTTD